MELNSRAGSMARCSDFTETVFRSQYKGIQQEQTRPFSHSFLTLSVRLTLYFCLGCVSKQDWFIHDLYLSIHNYLKMNSLPYEDHEVFSLQVFHFLQYASPLYAELFL